MNIARVIAVALSLAALPPLSDGQVEVSKLGELVGFTVVADTNIQGEFEGPDFDRVVKLDNGWVLSSTNTTTFMSTTPKSSSLPGKLARWSYTKSGSREAMTRTISLVCADRIRNPLIPVREYGHFS
jgi:hypothetical protein